MSGASFAQRLTVTGTLPRLRSRNGSAVRIGFLLPRSGPEKIWGQPGLDGASLWSDWINERGGLMIGGRRHPVEILSHDTASGPEATLRAAQEMVETHGACLVLTLGGNEVGPAIDYLMSRRILTTTLLPTDLSPDRPYLIAPAEVHPLFNVTGVAHLATEYPGAKIALCSQNDLMGLPSLACYRAACAVAGLPVVEEVLYEEGAAAEGIVARMVASEADILCWCSSTPPMVRALTLAAFAQGFGGQILSCTGDGYRQLVAETSADFMARFTFQFPDFDDPALADLAFFFRRPQQFFENYNSRFPESWSAVSWEYASVLDLWHQAVERVETTSPVSVLAAMKRGRQMPHAFGPARWWGDAVFGIDNALVGNWPVVRLQDGHARIVAFASVIDWLDAHETVLADELSRFGQLWHQRIAVRPPLQDREGRAGGSSPPAG
ncbi:ABC transporter substrate-binding protein [Thioclava sp. GXIMD4216]|uniref:ABC transporter substrate-binding protein n=1 Tax=Thioclava sp. GXIMD4216 TaxID=3131929 RepID=UPI0030D02E29